ncbi:vWA domain-containing protein [Actinomycetospora straminea]|uniref:VWA domain-containing protein n=1 Tax=Actinomycetospora straminea TaxID=663607 RepID=A0ABP9DWJ6_9PSEU|nr:VWA domain-containing protein [Actinomycetospora straminea]MDD7932435.1 VWA domain-containing protein [Actinomycetospora straminea]
MDPDRPDPPGRAGPDLATLAARLAGALRRAGVPVDVGQATRFATGVVAADPASTRELYWVARVTLLTDLALVPAFDAVFDAVFRAGDATDTAGPTDPADSRGDQHAPPPVAAPARGTAAVGGVPRVDAATGETSADDDPRPVPVAASAAERLGARDFADLSPAELAALAVAMRRFRVATPPRPSRRHRASPRGAAVDLRATLRRARRTGGQPVTLARRTWRPRPRRLVVLCDISGSMEPYARALLQMLWCARVSSRAEIFTFATRLTRLTPALARRGPEDALARAGSLATDWSGGSRIGESIAEFTRRWGRRGMARGAVLLVVSDGWDTGDPALLGREMAHLQRLAHRVVWANPRTARPHFQPLARGIAAAWPHCDAVVSAHRLDALDELLEALRGDRSG